MVCPCVQLQIIQSRLSHCQKKNSSDIFLQYTHSMTPCFFGCNVCLTLVQGYIRRSTVRMDTASEPATSQIISALRDYIHGRSIAVVFLATILHFRCCVPSNFATISRATAVSIVYDQMLCPYYNKVHIFIVYYTLSNITLFTTL